MRPLKVSWIANVAIFILLAVVHCCWAYDEPMVELSSPKGRSEPCWLFTHMQKAGGSTIKDMIFKRWGRRRGAANVYDTKIWRRGQAETDRFVERFMNGTWDVVYGSAVEGMRHSVEFVGECKWFTVFRHPIPRLVSAFFYCKRVPRDILCAVSTLKANKKSFGLVDFARHWGNYGLRQFSFGQVGAKDVLAAFSSGELKVPGEKSWRDTDSWYLLKVYLDNRASAGVSKPAEDMAMYDLLRPAQDLIEKRYAAVGILEEFNTTLALFDASLGMRDMNWQGRFDSMGAANINSKNKELERQTLEKAWTDSELKSYIQLDLLLYEHAKAVFRKQVRLHGL